MDNKTEYLFIQFRRVIRIKTNMVLNKINKYMPRCKKYVD